MLKKLNTVSPPAQQCPSQVTNKNHKNTGRKEPSGQPRTETPTRGTGRPKAPCSTAQHQAQQRGPQAVRPSRSPAPTHGKVLCVWCGCSLRKRGARRASLSGSLCPARLLLAPGPPARGLCPPLKPGDLPSRVVSAWASLQPWDRTQPTAW